MATLSKAHQELFKRGPDECYQSFDDLYQYCSQQKSRSRDIWEHPQDLKIGSDLSVSGTDGAALRLNDWSFSQVCRMAGVSKDTINRLSRPTASKALEETLPRSC